MSSVYKELDKLTSTTHSMGQLIALLEDKLASVLLAENNDNATVAQNNDDGVNKCRLADHVHGVYYRSYLQLEALNDIINRLDIEEAVVEE